MSSTKCYIFFIIADDTYVLNFFKYSLRHHISVEYDINEMHCLYVAHFILLFFRGKARSTPYYKDPYLHTVVGTQHHDSTTVLPE
jgi:hypothetical protein